MRGFRSLSIAIATFGAIGNAHAEPLKIALIDPVTGPLASTGKVYETVVTYGIERLNKAGGFNGEPIELMVLDDAGGASVTSDRLGQAVAAGAKIVIKSLTSATAGQLSEDVRRHNLRNPEAPVIFINEGAEASDLTGAKCHFYNFRLGTTAPMRANALLSVMKSEGALNGGVYSINQNYSLGQDMQATVQRDSTLLDYKVVGSALHDISRIQDFTPYVGRIRESGAGTVITSSYGNDLLLLIKAAVDSGLKVTFGTLYLDQPGNVASAGAALLGSYIAAPYNVEVDKTSMPGEFRAKFGQYPTFQTQGHVVTMLSFIGEALKAVSGAKGAPVDAKAIALSLEKTKFPGPMGELSMRADDHQLLLPIVVSRMQEDDKFPVDGTKFGFPVVKVVSAADAIYPVQPDCKMVRP